MVGLDVINLTFCIVYFTVNLALGLMANDPVTHSLLLT